MIKNFKIGTAERCQAWGLPAHCSHPWPLGFKGQRGKHVQELGGSCVSLAWRGAYWRDIEAFGRRTKPLILSHWLSVAAKGGVWGNTYLNLILLLPFRNLLLAQDNGILLIQSVRTVSMAQSRVKTGLAEATLHSPVKLPCYSICETW